MKEKLKSTEVRVKIALLFLFSGFYLFANSFPPESRQFPQLLASISLILSVVALAIDFLWAHVIAGEIGDVDDVELKVVDEATVIARRRRFYQAWAILLVATGVGYLGGFLFSAVILFVAFGVVSGRRENLIRNLVVAGAMTVLVYVIFGRVMGVPLLNGVLW